VVAGEREPDKDRGWKEITELIWTLKVVPGEQQDMPKAGDDSVERNAGQKQFIYKELIPRYWKSAKGASLALRKQADELLSVLTETVGVAEELAVEKALAPGGVMNRASILRGRALKGLERDRATYAQLRERDLGEESDEDE
jgi:hypothetical protein